MKSPASGRRQVFRCAGCENEVFGSLDLLEAHMRVQHVHFFPYECSHCDFARFPTEKTLRDHYRNNHPGRRGNKVFVPFLV